MLAPMRPKPIIPSCIHLLLVRISRQASRLASLYVDDDRVGLAVVDQGHRTSGHRNAVDRDPRAGRIGLAAGDLIRGAPELITQVECLPGARQKRTNTQLAAAPLKSEQRLDEQLVHP